MTTYCGILLTGEKDQSCAVAFITNGTVNTYSTPDDERIIELVEEYRPSIIALNAPPEPVRKEELHRPAAPEQPDEPHPDPDTERSTTTPETDNESENVLDPETAKMYRSGEEELINEGYSLLPHEMRSRRLLERATFLTNTIQRSGVGAKFIESNPKLIAQRLNVTDDRHLEAYGLETTDIDTVWEFDAVLLAYTAKLFDEDSCDGDDIVLPEDPTELD